MLSKALIESFAKVGAGQGAPQDESDFSNNGFPFIRAGHIEELLAGKDESALPKVNSESAKKNKLKLYEPGTIVFAKSGMSATKGRIYKLIEKFKIPFSNNLRSSIKPFIKFIKNRFFKLL